jgi:hypothetical protein
LNRARPEGESRVTRTIWLASHPKSGNTWFRMMVANLLAGGGKPIDINDPPGLGPHACAREPFDHLLMIDSGLLTHDEIDCLRPRVYEELARGGAAEEADEGAPRPVRFMLVHDAYQLTPKGEALLGGRRGADGAILIVRDPRDVAPSLASHMRVSLDRAIEFMDGGQREPRIATDRLHRLFRQRSMGWSGHALSWLEQTDLPVCIVRYEDMRADTFAVFSRALAFAGVSGGDEAIRQAIAFANFAELRGQELRKGFRESPQRPGGPFFRRGEAGAWRDELTGEQVARIETAHAPMMRRLGYGPDGATPLADAQSAALQPSWA